MAHIICNGFYITCKINLGLRTLSIFAQYKRFLAIPEYLCFLYIFAVISPFYKVKRHILTANQCPYYCYIIGIICYVDFATAQIFFCVPVTMISHFIDLQTVPGKLTNCSRQQRINNLIFLTEIIFAPG